MHNRRKNAGRKVDCDEEIMKGKARWPPDVATLFLYLSANDSPMYGESFMALPPTIERKVPMLLNPYRENSVRL